MPERLLITGASGFLGWNLCRAAHDAGWEVHGTVRSHTTVPEGTQAHVVDLTDVHATRAMFLDVSPHAVIHAAAEARPNVCQDHPTETRRINVDAAAAIAGLCADFGTVCAFTSTDLVFDGSSAPYSETSPVAPVSAYGEQKVAAEEEMRRRNPSVVVCRMPLMYGDPSPASGSFVQPLVSALREGRQVRLFIDEFRTVAGALSAAQGLLMALGQGGGVLHLGGRERVSRHAFGLKLAACIGVDPSLIAAARQADVPMAAPRPPDVSLDSSRAFALGYAPFTMDREFARLTGLATRNGAA